VNLDFRGFLSSLFFDSAMKNPQDMDKQMGMMGGEAKSSMSVDK
jgi:hypothetical protein